MLNTVMIYEAVRVAEREMRSAQPNAPIMDEPERSRAEGRFVGFRLRTSSMLHRVADALEPNCEVPAPVTGGGSYGCT